MRPQGEPPAKDQVPAPAREPVIWPQREFALEPEQPPVDLDLSISCCGKVSVG